MSRCSSSLTHDWPSRRPRRRRPAKPLRAVLQQSSCELGRRRSTDKVTAPRWPLPRRRGAPPGPFARRAALAASVALCGAAGGEARCCTAAAAGPRESPMLCRQGPPAQGDSGAAASFRGGGAQRKRSRHSRRQSRHSRKRVFRSPQGLYQ